MSWRKWLVRILVFSATSSLAIAGFLYQRWTNPAAVRQQVLDQLRVHFPGASITVESAHMRLLGGIALSEVRLARQDDPEKTEFAYFPSAIIYHDKEQLVQGRLVIRKVELYRPRVHIIRGPDGRWNVDGLIGAPRPKEWIPTIVIQLGTVILEDRQGHPDAPPVEIKDVNATLLNDPLPTVTFQAKGISEWLGALQAGGTWQRSSNECSFTFQAEEIAVGPALMERLGTYSPTVAEHAQHLEGIASLKAQVDFHPDAARPWTHQVSFQLNRGKLSHPQLPLPLDQLEATLRWTPDQVKLESLTAAAGEARVRLNGTAQALDPDSDFEGDLTISRLPLTSEIFQGRLPANLQQINTDYHPLGPVSLTYHCERRAGQWKKRCLVKPEDLTATFKGFQYTLEHLTGVLNQEIDTEKHLDVLTVDLAGKTGDRRVFIKGNVTGEGSTAAVDLKIWGDDLPLDQKLMDALSPGQQELARSFHPAGLANIEAVIRRPLGSHEFANRFLVHFHHAAMRYKEFPYPLEDVSGLLDIQPDHWEFRDFHGIHQGGSVRASCRSNGGPNKNRVVVEINGQNFLIDSELEAAVQPDLKRVWHIFSPSGRMHFVARVECLPAQAPDIDVTASAVDCSIKPAFFSYLLTGLSGTIHYSKGQVLVQKVTARHGPSILTLDEAHVFLKPGGVWAKVQYLHFDPLLPDDDLKSALPPLLAKVCDGLRLRDPLSLKTQLVIDTNPGGDNLPVIYWEGDMALHDATVYAGVPLEHVSGKAACIGRCSGPQLEGILGNLLLEQATIFSQPFQQIHTSLIVEKKEPEVLKLPDLKARLFGGDIHGEGRIEFVPSLRYTLYLKALGLHLEEFAQQNLGSNDLLSGQASAALLLTGQGTDIQDLSGDGNVDVPTGRLYNLPLLLDLLKVLGLRKPDGTAFEEAHGTFAIRGPRVQISRLELLGNSFSLHGQGEMNLDGTDINLDFYAIWARTLQLLPPFVKEISSTLSRYFFMKIQMRGRIGDVHCTKEPVPVLVDPVKGLLERMSGKHPESDKVTR